MARSLYSPRSALFMGCLFLIVAQVTLGQTQAPRPDELKFNGNSADQQQQQQQQQQQTSGDTTIISDQSRPLNGRQQAQDNLADNFYEDPNAPRPGPLPWPFTPSFGFGVAPPSRGQALWHQLMGGPGRLFDRLDQPMRHFDRQFEHMSRSLEHQFRDLERKASTGEGQDVSYFQRNGVAYVRTCTTRRVMPNGQSASDAEQEQKDMVPLGPTTPVLPINNNQQQQQQQQQPDLQQQQGFSPEVPSLPSSSAAPIE